MPTRAEVIREFVPASPFAAKLGLRLERAGDDEAVLVLPFRPELATMGDVMHGGAISALIDTAGMAAAWADDTEPESLAGSTVGLTVDFLAAAKGSDLTARGRVLRRGRSLCFCEVDVTDSDGEPVAKGLMTHRYSEERSPGVGRASTVAQPDIG
jgi:uncharacterized protein (TIGR00369 family)